ncbi:MAG: FtsX-like permease family protein [Acidobacteriia bacterium]|nr:FtsX-like permease family protein [Terriglobia bacterium]
MAAIGLYGLISYSVAQTTHEIGIRMALGAKAADVVGMVLRKAALLALLGVALGIGGAFLLTGYLKTLLFAVTPTDLLTLVVVSATLFATAVVASLIPARRAARVDPSVALKYE